MARHLVRTAMSPRCGPVRATGTGSRPGGPIPAQQVPGYCRARGGSRGLLPQAGAARLARQPLGKPFTLDGL